MANNIDRIETPEPSGWHQYVVVHGYQGNANRGAIFVDGVLSVTLDRPTQLTTTGTNFSIGKEFGSPTDINVYMDDFQIYDVALTDAEIQTLYTNGSLTNPDFSSDNLKVSLFPNPASNSITIAMETELKSVEIYSILGQKVLSGSKKEINISTLLSGMYMVRVQDVDGGFATKKVVKE